MASGARRRCAASSSCRSGSTSRRSGRPARSPDVDVVSVGADPHRDFELLLDGRTDVARDELPRRHDGRSRARRSPNRPANLSVETDLPFDEMRRRLERARVVALPVRENSYSGATTVLLQAMALAKPVVVTRTAAIATGYGLVDGDNVRLVAPGDAAAFGRALVEVLGDGSAARALGVRRAHRRGGAHVGAATWGGSTRSSVGAALARPPRRRRRLSSAS